MATGSDIACHGALVVIALTIETKPRLLFYTKNTQFGQTLRGQIMNNRNSDVKMSIRTLPPGITCFIDTSKLHGKDSAILDTILVNPKSKCC